MSRATTNPTPGSLFKSLHGAPGGFIMPNAWDAGSAAILSAVGFRAIATTSAGIAFSLGRQDYDVRHDSHGVSREVMFERIGEIVNAVEIPVSADLEAGYGHAPEAVAETIGLAMDAGLAGANIEDRIPGEPGLYDEALAIDRLSAAREIIDSRGGAFVLTARTDAFLTGYADPAAESIRRANQYRLAGADCLYAPGPTDLETIGLLVREIDGPINVVMGLGNAAGDANELLAAGVQRISLGGSMARSALAWVRRCAEEVFERGTVGFAQSQLSQSELNELFAGQSRLRG